MQGHRLPATLDVTGLNPDSGKINLIKIEKISKGFLTLKKSASLQGKKGRLSWYKKHYQTLLH